MIASALPADPLDRFDLVVDQDAEPLDVDRFLNALDRMVERRLSQRTKRNANHDTRTSDTTLIALNAPAAARPKSADVRFPPAHSTPSAWGETQIAAPGRVKLPIYPRPLRNRGLAGGFRRRTGRLLEAGQVKPAYSDDAYQIDRTGKKRCLWRYTPGIASEFIHHLPDLLAKRRKPLVLYCRVSSEKQEESGNLDDQVNGAIRELQGMGFKVGYDLFVFQHVGSSSIHAYRTELERAIEEARKRDGIVVAMHRDRLIRSGSFDGRTETEAPTIYEYMQLRRMAGDIPLATIRHPDQPARSDQIKRGQTAKRAERRTAVETKVEGAKVGPDRHCEGNASRWQIVSADCRNVEREG